MDGWFIDIIDKTLCNPQGEVFADLRKNLYASKIEELREFIEEGISRAVSQARYEFEHAHGDPENGNNGIPAGNHPNNFVPIGARSSYERL
jgi:hypothetical protein